MERVETAACAIEETPGPRAAAISGVATAHAVRRLRYFRDLLLQGYQSAMNIHAPSVSLRNERVALGIGLPELDAVSVWSTRRKDGAVSIPFIEYVLTQARECLEVLRKAWAPGPGKSALLRQVRSLDRFLEEVSLYGAAPSSLPRLGDLFLPEGLVSRLCAPGGLLDRLAGHSQPTLWKGGAGDRNS